MEIKMNPDNESESESSAHIQVDSTCIQVERYCRYVL